MPLWLRAMLSFLALPFNVTVTVPALILWGDGAALRVHGATAFGLFVFGIGATLMAWTILAFYRLGRGTLAPWDPPRRFVVAGPYRHWRHPMISGVNLVLLGEALLFASWPLLAWQLVFLALNMIYLPLIEERDLVARFGDAYRTYQKAVPRWLPRLRPYRPEREETAQQ